MDEFDESRRAKQIGPILWRGKYLIVAAVAVMLVLAYVYTSSSEKVYQATAIIQVSVPNQSATSDTTAANQGLAQNFATLLVSPGFLDKIRGKVENGRLSTSELESRLSANAILQTALVQLHSTGPSPRAAETVGTQVANAFLADLQSEATAQVTQQQAQIQRLIAGMSERISALESSSAPAASSTAAQITSLHASRQALIEQSASLEANGLARGTSASLSAPPAASSSPIKPKRSVNLLAGLLLGLLLGVGLAWLREALQPGLRSADDAAAVLDVPVLASIPLQPRMQVKDPALLEAYDVLHTNLFFAMQHDDIHVVTFVGPNPRVGKTSVVEGLAEVTASGGRNVLVVDGDLRMGTLTTRIGQGMHAGMIDLLQGEAELDDALVSLGPGLSLLGTRPSQLNAPSLLSSGRMRAVSAEWRERFDVVLIDSPPIGGLADGLILASLSDAVVMVARAGLTMPTELIASATSLRQSHTPIVGLVVFEERTMESYYPMPQKRVTARRDPATLS